MWTVLCPGRSWALQRENGKGEKRKLSQCHADCRATSVPGKGLLPAGILSGCWCQSMAAEASALGSWGAGKAGGPEHPSKESEMDGGRTASNLIWVLGWGACRILHTLGWQRQNARVQPGHHWAPLYVSPNMGTPCTESWEGRRAPALQGRQMSCTHQPLPAPYLLCLKQRKSRAPGSVGCPVPAERERSSQQDLPGSVGFSKKLLSGSRRRSWQNCCTSSGQF